MDDINKKVLKRLADRGGIRVPLNIPTGSSFAPNSYLVSHEYVELERPFGSSYLVVRITVKGRRALKPFYMSVLNYIAENWIALLAIVLALVSLIRTK